MVTHWADTNTYGLRACGTDQPSGKGRSAPHFSSRIPGNFEPNHDDRPLCRHRKAFSYELQERLDRGESLEHFIPSSCTALKYKPTTCKYGDWGSRCVSRGSGYEHGTCPHGGEVYKHDFECIVFAYGFWWPVKPAAWKQRRQLDLPVDILERLHKNEYMNEGDRDDDLEELMIEECQGCMADEMAAKLKQEKEEYRRKTWAEHLERVETIVLAIARHKVDPHGEKAWAVITDIVRSTVCVERQENTPDSAFSNVLNEYRYTSPASMSLWDKHDYWADVDDRIEAAWRLAGTEWLLNETRWPFNPDAPMEVEVELHGEEVFINLHLGPKPEGMTRNQKRLWRRTVLQAANSVKGKLVKVHGEPVPPIEVGGSGDCWKLLLGEDCDLGDAPISLGQLKRRLRNMLRDCPGMEEFAEGLLVKLVWTGVSLLHVEAVYDTNMGEWEEGCVPFLAIKSAPESAFHGLPGFSDWHKSHEVVDGLLTPVDYEIHVGSAADIVAEAMVLSGPEIAKIAAQEQFNADLASIPKTRIRIHGNEAKALAKYLGHPVISRMIVDSTSDHKFFEISRELLRVKLERDRPHATDFTSALHLGSTVREWNTWGARPGHKFQFFLGDDRDNPRMYEDTIAAIGRKLKSMDLPILKSRAGEMVQLKLDGIREAFEILNVGASKRFFLPGDQLPKVDWLYAEDSLYDMSPEMVDKYFVDTGAKGMTALLMIPDCMIDPNAAKSRIYEHTEYFPVVENVEEAIDKFWPEVLAITPLIPASWLNEALHEGMKKMLTHGWDLFTNWLTAIGSDAFPGELLVGNLMDIEKAKAIVVGVWAKLKRKLRQWFGRTRITWKGGFSNGYDHRTYFWEMWARKRRMSVGGRVYDWEIYAREGEMYLLKIYPSTGTSPISYQLSLPESKQTIMIADLETAWKPGLLGGTFQEPTYYPVLLQDFLAVVNWGMAEPESSLSYAAVMTMLNRVRGGLSLANNTLVEAMDINDKDVPNMALVCLLEICRRIGVISEIENSEDATKLYKSNVVNLAAKVAKYGILVATGGLAMPVWMIFKWLTETHPSLEYVKYPEPPKTITVQREKMWKPKNEEEVRKQRSNIPLTICLKGEEKPGEIKCMICDAYAAGAFSKDGVPSNGQCFHTFNHDVDDIHEIGFDSTDMVLVTQRFKDIRAEHEALSAAKLVPHLKQLEKWAENNSGGIQYKTKLSYIKGGPGTGKTEIIKSIACRARENGLNVCIAMPFKELQADYIEAKVLGYKNKVTFDADTLYWSTKRSNVDIWIIDEMTAVEDSEMRLLAIYLGVKHLILVGDEMQTKRNTANGEGVSPTDGKLDWTRIPSHELVWNYRLDPWRTKLLNHKYGYRMRCKNTLEVLPEFIDVDEYAARPKKPDREIVFAHASAPVVFGRESGAGKNDAVNLSVRTCQGKTFDTAAISCSMHDTATMGVHGMLCVAISRSRKQTTFVTPGSVGDPLVNDLKYKLHMDSPERIDAIRKDPWPNLPELKPEKKLTAEELRVNELLRRKDEVQTKISVDSDLESKQYTVDQIIVEKQVIHLNDDDIDLSYPCEEVLLKTFATCLFDAIAPDIEEKQLRKLRYDFLMEVYLTGYGEIQAKMDWTSYKKWKHDRDERYQNYVVDEGSVADDPGWRHPWKELIQNGKVAIGIEHWARWMAKRGHIIAVYNDKDRPITGPRYEQGRPTLFVKVKDHHATRMEEPTLEVTWEGINAVSQEKAWDRHRGKWLWEHFEKRKSTAGYKPATLRPTEAFLAQTREQVAAGFLTKVEPPDLGSLNRFATMRAPFFSGWKEEVKTEDQPGPIQTTKLRLGTDGYRLGPLIDPSKAWLRSSAINEYGGVAGQQVKTRTVIQPHGFIFDRTKAGRLKLRTQRAYYAQSPGMANHFNNTPEENLICAQRYGRLKRKPKLNGETKRWAKQVADDLFHHHWLPRYRANLEQCNTIIEGALKAAKQRNYHGRTLKSWEKGFGKPIIVFNGKAQRKPIKEGKLNVLKSGQGLAMSPPECNLEFISWMRLRGHLLKESAKDHFFTDDRETPAAFRLRLTRAIRGMPLSAKTGIMDFEEFDSQQGEVTVEVEKNFAELTGNVSRTIRDYYAIRGDVPFIMYGLFKGNMGGSKGSGFLDTKMGNTIVSTALATQVFKGQGRKLVAAKGDDQFWMQTGLHIDETAKRNIKTYTGMSFKCEVNRTGGEFCGETVSRAGMYPSITRTAMKARCAPARDYKMFCEHQISYRDKIADWKKVGLQELVHYSAAAEKKNPAYVEACLAYVNSMAHINRQQWESVTKRRLENRYYLPRADGPTLC